MGILHPGDYIYASVSLNSYKTYSLDPDKNCKFKAQDKLKYGFQYENQIKYINILFGNSHYETNLIMTDKFLLM